MTTGSPREHWGQRGGYLLKALLCGSRRAASIHPCPGAGTAVVRDPALRHPQKWLHSSALASVSEPPWPRVTLSLPPLLVLAHISFTVFRWARSLTVDSGQAKT